MQTKEIQQTIELDTTEINMVKRFAKQKGLTFDQAIDCIFNKGLNEFLSDVAPSSMAIKKAGKQ